MKRAWALLVLMATVVPAASAIMSRVHLNSVPSELLGVWLPVGDIHDCPKLTDRAARLVLDPQKYALVGEGDQLTTECRIMSGISQIHYTGMGAPVFFDATASCHEPADDRSPSTKASISIEYWAEGALNGGKYLQIKTVWYFHGKAQKPMVENYQRPCS